MTEVKFALYGVGAMGALIAKVALARPQLKLVGAIDTSPQWAGRDLGTIIGDKPLGIKVETEAERALQDAPQVILHATGSYLDRVYPQLVTALSAGANVISTCETLAYPYYRYPELSLLLDHYAKEKGVTLVGVGINPGYLLDFLPAILSAPCSQLRSIRAVRSLDASRRRLPFQKKIGLGLAPQDFKQKLASGELTAHVGFVESVLLLANILGWKLDKVEEGQEPVAAEGKVVGAMGFGQGVMGDKEVIRLEFLAQVGVEEYEEITLQGEPNLKWRSQGTPGDLATAAIVVNAIPRVLAAPPGLITVKDLPQSYTTP